jgi:hypothetical protein
MTQKFVGAGDYVISGKRKSNAFAKRTALAAALGKQFGTKDTVVESGLIKELENLQTKVDAFPLDKLKSQCKCIDAPSTKPPATCKLPGYKGDTRCDDENNVKSCGWDGGDCCLKTVQSGKVDKTYCKACKCLDPDNSGGSVCELPGYKADTRCDDQNNNKKCGWDGGDCCYKTVQGGKVSKDYCKECKCQDPDNIGEPPVSCGSVQFRGDGNCDDSNNNKGCGWDGGDCCFKTAKKGQVNKLYCKQCKCIDPDNLGEHACGIAQYKGDGNCDDENNSKACDYDGGDCCPATVKGGKVKKDFCKQCQCADPGQQKK